MAGTPTYTKQKLRAKHLGKIISVEQRKKISESMKGNKVSLKTRQKISAASKGKPWTTARRNAQKIKE